jgi:hypothetical protein
VQKAIFDWGSPAIAVMWRIPSIGLFMTRMPFVHEM